MKDDDSKLFKTITSLKTRCKCGHTEFMPVYVDSKYCSYCGKKLQNKSKPHFIYKLKKLISKESLI